MVKRISIKSKIKFLKRYPFLAKGAFFGSESDARKLVEWARVELKYSKKTYSADILHTLRRAWKEFNEQIS